MNWLTCVCGAIIDTQNNSWPLNRGFRTISCHFSAMGPFVIPKKKPKPYGSIQPWCGIVRSRERLNLNLADFHGVDKLKRKEIM